MQNKERALLVSYCAHERPKNETGSVQSVRPEREGERLKHTKVHFLWLHFLVLFEWDSTSVSQTLKQSNCNPPFPEGEYSGMSVN